MGNRSRIIKHSTWFGFLILTIMIGNTLISSGIASAQEDQGYVYYRDLVLSENGITLDQFLIEMTSDDRSMLDVVIFARMGLENGTYSQDQYDSIIQGLGESCVMSIQWVQYDDGRQFHARVRNDATGRHRYVDWTHIWVYRDGVLIHDFYDDHNYYNDHTYDVVLSLPTFNTTYRIYSVGKVYGIGTATGSVDQSRVIYDDDTIAPISNYSYTGASLDSNPGYITVSASDASGLSINPSGTYYLDPEIVDSPQEFTFIAVDADNDRVGDNLTTIVHASITLQDDDIVPPIISWTYVGDYTDANSGYITVESSDPANGDDLGLSVDPSGIYSVFNEPSTYSFSFTAVDNDNDRMNDQLTTTVNAEIAIIDDDTTVNIAGLECQATASYVTIQFSDIDYSGIASVFSVIVDGETVESFSIESKAGTWTLTLVNEWILDLGSHGVTFQLTDADNDRPDDAAVASFTCTFVVTEEMLVEWIDLKLTFLKDKVATTPASAWRNINNPKALGNKIDEVIRLKETGLYAECYSKVLHDVKPKLTGLHDDEQGNLYGNGIFTNPWVMDATLQQEFEEILNLILAGLSVLF